MTLLTKLVATAGALTLVVAAPFVALLMAYSTANPCHALAQEMLRYGVGADLSAPGVLGMRLAAEALARPMTATQCGEALADYYLGGAELRDAVMTARPEAVHRMPPRMPTNWLWLRSAVSMLRQRSKLPFYLEHRRWGELDGKVLGGEYIVLEFGKGYEGRLFSRRKKVRLTSHLADTRSPFPNPEFPTVHSSLRRPSHEAWSK